MTATQAIYEFFSSFDIPAYPSNGVPEETVFPWLTYENITSNWWGQQIVPITVNLWYRTESEAIPNEKAREITRKIGGGYRLNCDEGIITVFFPGNWTSLNDEADRAIKRKYTVMNLMFDTL